MASSKAPGYTLVELLTVIAITGIIGIIATTLLIGQQRFLTTQTFQAHNQAVTANALASLAEQLKTADRVVPTRDFTVNGTTATYTSGLHTLILALPSLDGSGAPILTSPQPFDYILVAPDPSNAAHLVLVTAPDIASSRKASTRTILSNLSVFNALYNYDPAGSTPPTVVSIVLGGKGDIVNTSTVVSQVSIRMRNI